MDFQVRPVPASVSPLQQMILVQYLLPTRKANLGIAAGSTKLAARTCLCKDLQYVFQPQSLFTPYIVAIGRTSLTAKPACTSGQAWAMAAACSIFSALMIS